MGNDLSTIRTLNYDEPRRSLPLPKSNSTSEPDEEPDAATVPGTPGVAAAGTPTYLALTNSSLNNVLIVANATSQYGSGFCICDIQKETLICRFYYFAPHNFGSDPRAFERRNAEFALRLWRRQTKRAHVTVYIENIGAIGRLEKNKTQLQSDCGSQKLLLQYQSKEEHIMRAAYVLSHGNTDTFKSLISGLYSKYAIQFVEENVGNI